MEDNALDKIDELSVQFAAIVDESSTIAICAHTHPDGDAIGSCLAMAKIIALKWPSKDVTLLLADNSCVPRIYQFLKDSDKFVPASMYEGNPDLFISLDLPVPDRLNKAEGVLNRSNKCIVIDHHLSSEPFGDLRIVDSSAAATGVIVAHLAISLGVHFTPDIANALFCAIVTDTGRFQYQNSNADALKITSLLVDAGADPSVVALHVYQSFRLAYLHLQAVVLSRIVTFYNDRIAYSYATLADVERCGAKDDESDGLIDIVRTVDGSEIAFFLREISGNKVHGNLRSKGEIDVSGVAKAFGGGGHKAAAAFTCEGTIDDIFSRLIPMLVDLLNGKDSDFSISVVENPSIDKLVGRGEVNKNDNIKAQVELESFPKTNALIAVNKPCGMTSHDVVSKVRRAVGEHKVGHAGTLDPLASGVLIIGIGQATRLLENIMLKTKVYQADIVFGASTTTDDEEGEIIDVVEVDENLYNEDYARELLSKSIGKIDQVPPSFSAVSVGGKRAYALSRTGKSPKLAPKSVELFDASLDKIFTDEKGRLNWRVTLKVSKGFYIRSFARDLGEKTGSLAHLSSLVRLASGSITLDDCLSLDELIDGGVDVVHKMAIDPISAINLPTRLINLQEIAAIKDGRALEIGNISKPVTENDLVAIYHDNLLYGVWRVKGKHLVCRRNFLSGIEGVK